MDTGTINLIIGGCIGILGASTGAVINGVFNRKNINLQLQEQRRIQKLIKIENLYQKTGELSLIVTNNYYTIRGGEKIVSGKAYYENISAPSLKLIANIMMSVRLYVPELSDQANDIANEHEDLMTQLLIFSVKHENEELVTKHMNKLSEKCLIFEGSIETMVSENKLINS